MGLRVESGVLHAAAGAAVLIQGAVALWLSRLDAEVCRCVFTY